MGGRGSLPPSPPRSCPSEPRAAWRRLDPSTRRDQVEAPCRARDFCPMRLQTRRSQTAAPSPPRTAHPAPRPSPEVADETTRAKNPWGIGFRRRRRRCGAGERRRQGLTRWCWRHWRARWRAKGGGTSGLRRLRGETWRHQRSGSHGQRSRGGRRDGCTDHSPPESLRVELAVELLPAAADANVEGAIWIAVAVWWAASLRVVVCGGGWKDRVPVRIVRCGGGDPGQRAS